MQNNNLSVLEKKLKGHWSKYGKDELKTVGQALERILLSDNCKQTLFMLDQRHFFDTFLPELAALKKVPQTKQNSTNAFHHSLLVASSVPKNRVVKWAALLHDIGKANYKVNHDGSLWFRNHEYEGAMDAKHILKRMKIHEGGNICKLVRYHSHPLDYQRQPNWKKETIQNFCDKHKDLATSLVDLAIADKISSSSNPDYLESLYHLKITVEEIQVEKKRL